MLDSFNALIVVRTLRRSYETPFDHIVPSENSSMAKEPEEGRDLGLGVWAPNQLRERITRERRGVHQRIGLFRCEHTFRCLTPSENVRVLQASALPSL